MKFDIGEIKLALEAIVSAINELNESLQPCGSELEIDRFLQIAEVHIGNLNQGDE